MKVEYINPFVESTMTVFETMLGCRPERGDIRLLGSAADAHHDVTALIGLTGTARGVVKVSFPGRTAMAVSSRLAGESHKEIDDSVTDALGELVNMIAGAAKAKFEGHRISVSLPTVIRGKDHSLNHPSGSISLAIPFNSELGDFLVCVSFSPAQ